MNVVAFIVPPERTSPLARKAELINKQFARLGKAEERISKAHEKIASAEMTECYARLNAGRYLIQARKLLGDLDPAASFEAWCIANVRRSMRDCYKCMYIASQDDPERAIWKERSEGAEDKAQARSADRQDSGVQQQTKSVQTAIGLYRKMNVDQRNEVKTAQEEIDHAA